MKLYITGTWRSGTTLLSQIFNAHSTLSVTYDAVNFMRFGYKRYGTNNLTLENAITCAEDINTRLQSRFNHSIDLDNYKSTIKNSSSISYSLIYDTIMKLYTGNKTWGEKTVLQWRAADDILNMFDDIFFLHIVRDPRDVMCSWKKYTIAPGVDYLDALGNCFDSMNYGLKNKGKARYILIKYEDLLEDPETVISEICETIGISFEHDMLNVNNYRNKVTGDLIVNSSYSESFQAISKEPIGRWKTYLDKEDEILCDIILGAIMNEFNYQTNESLPNSSDSITAFDKLKQSDLAWSGVLNVLKFGEGVQRNPLNEFDSSTWETDKDKL